MRDSCASCKRETKPTAEAHREGAVAHDVRLIVRRKEEEAGARTTARPKVHAAGFVERREEPSVLDVVHLGSTFALRAMLRVGSAHSVLGVTRFSSAISVRAAHATPPRQVGHTLGIQVFL